MNYSDYYRPNLFLANSIFHVLVVLIDMIRWHSNQFYFSITFIYFVSFVSLFCSGQFSCSFCSLCLSVYLYPWRDQTQLHDWNDRIDKLVESRIGKRKHWSDRGRWPRWSSRHRWIDLVCFFYLPIGFYSISKIFFQLLQHWLLIAHIFPLRLSENKIHHRIKVNISSITLSIHTHTHTIHTRSLRFEAQIIHLDCYKHVSTSILCVSMIYTLNNNKRDRIGARYSTLLYHNCMDNV